MQTINLFMHVASKKKYFFVPFFLFFITCPLFSQQTQTYAAADLSFRNGITLLDKQLFGAAKQQFLSYLAQKPTPTQTLQAEYYAILCDLHLQEENIANKVQDFANRYGGSLQSILLYQQAANYFFVKSDYENTIFYANAIENQQPISEDDYQTAFQLGYAYFMKGNYDKALNKFNVVKQQENRFTAASNYYAGYIYFLQNNDNEAISNLEKATTEKNYREEADKILPLIYYRQGRYNDVISYGKNIESKGEQLSEKTLLLMGNSYYEKQDFVQAAKYLDSYVQFVPKIDRNTAYRFGFALAEVRDTEKATLYFTQVAEGKDSLAQNAAYNLGILYLESPNKQLAVNAFEKVRTMEQDKKLQEQGALNYAKINYELKDFPKTIQACNFFLQNFANSPHEDDINNLLTDSYLNSGNYAQALAYLEKIPTKSKKMQVAYQRISYNQAVEFFNADKYKEAENLLRKSLKHQPNKDLANTANYWLGEIYSYEEKYDSALVYYNRLTANSTVFYEAFYGKGYAAYNLKDYETAKGNFEKYIASGNNEQNKADAQLRLADCYFVAKDYENALVQYNQAEVIKGADLEYLAYQKGVALANQGKPDEALQYLDKVLVQYPNSKYYEAALYRKGVVSFDHHNKTVAITHFSKLLNERPQSVLVPDALAKRAICYQLQNEQEKAMEDFVLILQNHATHPAAEDAIQALQDLQEKGYQIPNYEALTEKFTTINPNSKAAMNGDYNAAKANYDNANYARAINALQNFVKKYPDSELAPDAFYFLAMSYDQSADYENALFAFSKVKGNYEIRALQRAAEIEYQRNNYFNANLKYDLMLKNPTLAKRYEGNALAGMMLCNFQLKNYEKVKDLANQLYNKNHTKFWSMADLYLAKTMIEKEEMAAALLQLQKTTQAAQDIYGAEAQYTIGLLLRKQKKYEESTKALIEVRNKYVNYTTWLYEAFLLIADNYIDLNNKFQAKATLQSIIDNSADEKVKEKARQKLSLLN
jgi:TolA-binding protein